MNKPEEHFLEYNIDNIFINLLQLETHLKNLDTTDYKENYAACLAKHLAEVQGEAAEAISHSMAIAPGKVNTFKELKDEAYELRKNLKSTVPTIIQIRKLRRKVELVNPNYNTANCRACGKVENGLKKIKSNFLNEPLKEKVYKGVEHNNNSVFKNGETMIDLKDAGVIATGNFVGKGVTLLGDYVDFQMGKTGATILQKPSTWINIGGGVAGILAALYLVKDKKIGVPLTIASSHMLTKAVDYVATAARGGAILGPSSSVRVMGRRAGLHVPAVGEVPEFTDRGLINVD